MDTVQMRDSSMERDAQIDRVADYAGQEAIVAEPWPSTIGSRDLSRSERRRILAEWLEFFRQPSPIKHLTLWCRVTDEILEGISTQTQLETLTLHWGPYTELSHFLALTRLRELTLGGASAITDLNPVAQLRGLTHLSVENARKLRDYTPLGQLTGLRYLSVDRGITGSRADAESIDFVRDLPNLRTLYWDPRVAPGDYSALLSLTEATEVHVSPSKGMTPSIADLEWALPGMQAHRRRRADHTIPLYEGEKLIGWLGTNVAGRMEFLPPDANRT
ncbi:hypothetical protein [Microbacterium hatanonis]|uniref:Leucine-rich repeat domain-containing protein n=1 Tax=Microbacterium hatanonis TaxID=404366 RepID=A0A5C8I2Q7_9MICO|nr:hypothetical protein [Microbacterium hatanonis]TXK12314.1 hypothetical protein FVP77_02195 [Microbacterium hatanonis]